MILNKYVTVLGDCVGHSLKDQLRSRSNSLNAIRLVLAFAVIVSHSWPLGGYGQEPKFAGETLGTWAVFGFFTISGYLIMGSRASNKFSDFLERRLRRIFPAFLVCLLVTAFIFAPVGYWKVHCTLHGFTSTRVSPINYVLSNVTLKINHYNVAGGPIGVPYRGAWDGALWSLYYEFAFYLIIGLVAGLTIFKRRPTAVISFLLVIFTVSEYETTWIMKYAQNSDLHWLLKLGPFFLAGSLFFVLRERVPTRAWLAVLSALLLLVVGLWGTPRLVVFCALPLAYLCLWLGAKLPLKHVGRTNDISYGVYIYGFPVQQLLATFGLHKHGQILYILLTAVVVLPLAGASWFFVERPSIGIRTRLESDEVKDVLDERLTFAAF